MRKARPKQIAAPRATSSSWNAADAEQHPVEEQEAKLEVLDEGEHSRFSDAYSVDRVLAKVDRAMR
jgi:hypothetical protein